MTTTFTSFDLMDKIIKSGVIKKLELNNVSKLVLMALASHYNNKKQNCYPSQTLLAEELDIGLRSVSRAIKELTTKSVIVSASHTGINNTYKFTNLFLNLILTAEQEKNNPCQDDTSTPATMTHNPCQDDTLTNNKQINKPKNFKNFKNTNDFDRELASHLSSIRITETKQYIEESLKTNKKAGSPLEYVEKITPHQAKVLMCDVPRELHHTAYYKALEEKARQLTFAEVC